MAALPAHEFRARFPILERRTYVNSCSQGALSIEVAEAMQRFLASWDADGSPWEHWVERVEQLRTRFAGLIGADRDEVAVMPSASAGISAVMTALAFDGPRREVVAGSFEFPTMGQILLAQEPRGARVRWVQAEGDTLPVESYAAAIDERTLLVPASHICFRNGFRLDLAALTALCRERGAYVFVDDYQHTGCGPLDVHALGIDFLVTGCLKYLLGPAGVAFLYVRRDLIDRLQPTVTGWFGRVDPFAFAVDRLDWAPGARRFEAGTPPIPNVYGALAGLDLLESFGLDRVRQQIEALVERFVSRARAAGCTLKTPHEPERRGPLVVVQSTDAQALVARLADRGVVASARGNGLRVSFHAYNSDQDVDMVIDILAGEAALLESRSAVREG